MNHLREVINASYQKGVKFREAAEAERLANAARKQQDIQQRCLAVMSALPSAFEQAGMKNEKSIKVCSTFHRHEQFYIPEAIERGGDGFGNTFEVQDVPHGMFNAERYKTAHLSEHGKAIWKQLTDAGLKPYIKYGWDGCGDFDWHEIWVDVPQV